MAGQAAETLIGALVLAAAGVFLVYATNTADVAVRGGYPLVAEFRKAEGLSIGSDVRVAGVKVGSVTRMRLNPETYFASVTFVVEPQVQVPEDSMAKIASGSLLGEAYLAVEPGAAEDMLEPGGEIVLTQSSVSVGDLIGKFIGGAESQ